MNANRHAPVFGASEIEIAAEPDAVWDVLTDFGRWTTWNPDVKAMSIEGDVAPGTNFRWKAGPASITSTIQRVERPRLIRGRGKRSACRRFTCTDSTPGTAERSSIRRSRLKAGSRVSLEDR